MSQLDTTYIWLDTCQSAVSTAISFPNSIDEIVKGCLRDANDSELLEIVTRVLDHDWVSYTEASIMLAIKVGFELDIYDDSIIELAETYRLGHGYTFCFLEQDVVLSDSWGIEDLDKAEHYVTFRVCDNWEFFSRVSHVLQNVSYEDGMIAHYVVRWLNKSFGSCDRLYRSVPCPCIKALDVWDIDYFLDDDLVCFTGDEVFGDLLLTVGLALEEGFDEFRYLLAPALEKSGLYFDN